MLIFNLRLTLLEGVFPGLYYDFSKNGDGCYSCCVQPRYSVSIGKRSADCISWRLCCVFGTGLNRPLVCRMGLATEVVVGFWTGDRFVYRPKFFPEAVIGGVATEEDFPFR